MKNVTSIITVSVVEKMINEACRNNLNFIYSKQICNYVILKFAILEGKGTHVICISKKIEIKYVIVLKI